MTKTEIYTNVSTSRGKVLYRGYDSKTGVRFQRRINHPARLWVEGTDTNGWKSLDGVDLKTKSFSTISEAQKWKKQYSGVSNMDIYGNTNFEYQWIYDNFPGDVEWDMKNILIANIDIEVDSNEGFPEPIAAAHPVTAITIDYFDQIIVLGHDAHNTMDKFDNKNEKKIVYISCSSEVELLREFLSVWHQYMPDIVTGWNIEGFDLPYLHNRIERILGEDYVSKLSPWNNVWKRETRDKFGNVKEVVSLSGVSILDYMLLYDKYAPPIPLDNRKLGTVGEAELNMPKIDFEAASLHDLYKTDFQKYLDYNIRDTEIIRGLEHKHKLIQMACSLAYDGKFNFQDVFKQVRMWDVLTTNYLLDKKTVVPNPAPQESRHFEGGYVKEPVLGFHKNVASFDLDSLYPHLLMQYNISPETIIPRNQWTSEMESISVDINTGSGIDRIVRGEVNLSYLQGKSFGVAGNGQFFSNVEMGFLPAMMREMYSSRSQIKKNMISEKIRLENFSGSDKEREKIETNIAQYNCLQLAKKVCLNSAYGALGNQHFRFFDIRLATAITHSGQLSTKWIIDRVNRHMNKILDTDKDYIIAGDTDSIYLSLEDLVAKVQPKGDVVEFMDKVCSTSIQKTISSSYIKLADKMNAFEQKMNMSREVLADKAIWTAKKRYILNVRDDEGVRLKTPKLKISGLEAIKSTTPHVCRESIKGIFRIIMTGNNNDVIEYINNFRTEFRKMKPEQISKQSSVKGLLKYKNPKTIFQKGTPQHVKGALLYNNILTKQKLDGRYDIIHEGEHIKICYLKKPNPLKNDVISFLYTIPDELGLQEYVDYDTQFEKTYLEPVRAVLDKIGWTVERTNTLF